MEGEGGALGTRTVETRSGVVSLGSGLLDESMLGKWVETLVDISLMITDGGMKR